MKITFDREADALSFLFSDKPIEESTELKPGIFIDYAADGTVVGIELLEATRHTVPTKVEFEME
jgi:uncharacterized protein YuzE